MRKKTVRTKRMQIPSHSELGYTYQELRKFMSPKELAAFDQWIEGQTCGSLPSGESIFYAWDVKRFLDWFRNGTPTYFD